MKRPNTLKNPVFISALLLLLLNDHIFKYQFHNTITGKLSDIAGLFIFPAFWAFFIPKYKKAIYWSTAILFVYWKSSWSQPLIDILANSIFPITRTIDYTDLWTLAILPVSYQYFNTKNSIQLRHISTSAIAIISFFAFCATSKPKDRTQLLSIQRNYNKEFKTKRSREQLLSKINAVGLEYTIDSVYDIHAHVEANTTEKRTSIDTLRVREIIRIKNISYNQDTLKELFIKYSTAVEYNLIKIYGYRFSDTPVFYPYNDKYSELIKDEKEIIKKGFIEKVQ